MRCTVPSPGGTDCCVVTANGMVPIATAGTPEFSPPPRAAPNDWYYTEPQMTATTATDRTQADFCIEIGFQKGTPEPARVFRAMTGLIEAFQTVDKMLVQSLDVAVEPMLLLENVEAASIKAWLRSVLMGIDDDALKKMDWKAAVGVYLVRAKYIMVDFLGKRSTISNRAEIVDLQQKLLAAADEMPMDSVLFHSPLSETAIVESLRIITEPLSSLVSGDSALYITGDEREAPFNISFGFAPETIQDLLTKEIITSTPVMILKVRRPDYLGESMWEFRHEGHPFPAKLLAVEWLRRFQDREVEVRPGDALRAKVELRVHYGYDGEVVNTHRSILEVLEVIQLEPPPQQTGFLA